MQRRLEAATRTTLEKLCSLGSSCQRRGTTLTAWPGCALTEVRSSAQCSWGFPAPPAAESGHPAGGHRLRVCTVSPPPSRWRPTSYSSRSLCSVVSSLGFFPGCSCPMSLPRCGVPACWPGDGRAHSRSLRTGGGSAPGFRGCTNADSSRTTSRTGSIRQRGPGVSRFWRAAWFSGPGSASRFVESLFLSGTSSVDPCGEEGCRGAQYSLAPECVDDRGGRDRAQRAEGEVAQGAPEALWRPAAPRPSPGSGRALGRLTPMDDPRSPYRSPSSLSGGER